MKRVAIRLAVLALLLAVLVVFWSLVPSLWSKETTLDLGGGVRLEMVWIPGGSFTMGSRASAEDLAKRCGGKAGYYAREHPAHEVALDGFWMGKYEVTNAQFLRFRPDHYRGMRPERKSPGDSRPVYMVSWEDAKAFCAWLSGKSGKTIALPSEAQWEYACRAGTTTERYWGDDEASMGRYANVRDRAWKAKFPDVMLQPTGGGMLEENMTVATDDGHADLTPVGSYRPNAFGLYDMIGNVCEWCQDYYGEAYYGSSAGRNPTGAETGQQRVTRGGSWLEGIPWACRSAFRGCGVPSDSFPDRGFRVVASRTSLSPSTTPTPSPTPTPTLTPTPLPPEPAYVEDLGGGVRLEMVWIPGGRFMMGSPASEAGKDARDADEGPVHEVTLDGFWMGKFEVTQAQYEAIMGSNPSYFKGRPDNPVEMVSWDDATEFCRRLSQRTGKTCILPSEAQWEYACRAGSQGRFSFGDSDNQLGEYAWYDGNAGNTTHPVGQTRPNAFGLYDMHGNVWEWCLDWYHDSYAGGPADGSAWLGPASDSRVLRGGSYYIDPGGCRSANRDRDTPGGRSGGSGFRVVASRMN